MDNGRLINIVEALLFAAAEPLQAKAICKVVDGAKEDEIAQAVAALNDRYMQADSSFRVREIAGGFQLHTLPDYANYIEVLLAKTKIQRLSAPALETLAVIAYRQPVSTPEIEKIRGVESSGVLRTLLERNLVAITGRSDGPGRPLLYGTTREFLYYFGLNELRELPRIEELEKLLEQQDFSRQLSIELDVDAAPNAEKTAGGEEIPKPEADAEVSAGTEQPAAMDDIVGEPAEDVPTDEPAEIPDEDTKADHSLTVAEETNDLTDVPEESPKVEVSPVEEEPPLESAGDTTGDSVDEPAIALAEDAVTDVTDPVGDHVTETIRNPEKSPATAETSLDPDEPASESDSDRHLPPGEEPPVDESTKEDAAPRQLVMKRTTPEPAEVEDARPPREMQTDPEQEQPEPVNRIKRPTPDDEELRLTELDVPLPKDATDQDDNGELIKTAKDVLDTPPD